MLDVHVAASPGFRDYLFLKDLEWIDAVPAMLDYLVHVTASS